MLLHTNKRDMTYMSIDVLMYCCKQINLSILDSSMKGYCRMSVKTVAPPTGHCNDNFVAMLKTLLPGMFYGRVARNEALFKGKQPYFMIITLSV